ncbi:50S ribosomal protein L23 [Candidatus Gottesmanbacteria bacterium]|nr:50S ribosomal protein L23 [Candidatus Gottesmanbacteria bacterium]
MKRVVVKKPMITEKTLSDARRGVFTFEVAKDASKKQIAESIERIYNVHVMGVKTLIKKGKVKVAGKKRMKVKLPDIKKAYMRLKQGEKIDAFEVGETK